MTKGGGSEDKGSRKEGRRKTRRRGEEVRIKRIEEGR